MHRIHQKFESPIVDGWVELILHQKSIDFGNWWERFLINLYFLSSLQLIACQIWCMISDSQDSVSWNQDTNFQVAKNFRFYLLTLTWLYIMLNQTPRKTLVVLVDAENSQRIRRIISPSGIFEVGFPTIEAIQEVALVESIPGNRWSRKLCRDCTKLLHWVECSLRNDWLWCQNWVKPWADRRVLAFIWGGNWGLPQSPARKMVDIFLAGNIKEL